MNEYEFTAETATPKLARVQPVATDQVGVGVLASLLPLGCIRDPCMSAYAPTVEREGGRRRAREGGGGGEREREREREACGTHHH